MTRRLLLVPAFLLSVAVLGCPTADDVKKVQANVDKLNADVTIWADSMRAYTRGLHSAVCGLALKTTTALPTEYGAKCVGGGPETVPPPKYPPK